MNTEKVNKGTFGVLKAIGLAVVGIVTKELWEKQPLNGLAKLKLSVRGLILPIITGRDSRHAGMYRGLFVRVWTRGRSFKCWLRDGTDAADIDWEA